MTEIDKTAEVAGYIWDKGWGERNGGNITVDITDSLPQGAETIDGVKLNYDTETVCLTEPIPYISGHVFYVKGTQCRMRDLARRPMQNGCIILITDDSKGYKILTDNGVKPTSELPSHLMVQNYLSETNSGYKATLHTHPIELVAMSHIPIFTDKTVSMGSFTANPLTKVLWSMIPETLAFAPLGIGIVPYETPGSIELARATLQEIKHYDVVLWEKHGTFAVGKDIMDAFDQTDVLNKAAIIYLKAKQTGSEPTGMSIEQMTEVQRIFNLPSSRIPAV